MVRGGRVRRIVVGMARTIVLESTALYSNGTPAPRTHLVPLFSEGHDDSGRERFILFVCVVLWLVALPLGTAWAQGSGVSVTADNQILVELQSGDTEPARLFDLNDRTIVFTPDGHGRYSRAVKTLDWESEIGSSVDDRAEIELTSFVFDFAGQRWGSFFVSRLGLISFGQPFTYSPPGYSPGSESMQEIAGLFAIAPIIAPLYKPLLGGAAAEQHVASSTDKVVVTWSTTEPHYYAHGVAPSKPSRFQLVLSGDGSIAISYTDMGIHDGIVGLFTAEGVEKGDRILGIPDATDDTALPDHLDLKDLAIYKSTDPNKLIVEWTLGADVSNPAAGRQHMYRLLFADGRQWLIALRSDGTYWTRGGDRWETDNLDRIALLADLSEVAGLSTRVHADVGEFDGGDPVRTDQSRAANVTFPTVSTESLVDLSSSDETYVTKHSEVFHHRRVLAIADIACRIIDATDDNFDLFVFHSEFRADYQESGSDWQRYRQDIGGIGGDLTRRHQRPCGDLLKGHWKRPVWMQSREVFLDSSVRGDALRTGFEFGLVLFAHELAHHWTAWASFAKDGQNESLAGDPCRCHWRRDLHLPAAFPWSTSETGARSIMGGRHWQENDDGTFTPLDGYWGGGFSWLDLYAIGIVDANEVPDMFILRDAQHISGNKWSGTKETITIQQVIEAEGSRAPTAAGEQKHFNAGFVYLLAPGASATPDTLALHKQYRDQAIAHWFHITGERSRITTNVSTEP